MMGDPTFDDTSQVIRTLLNSRQVAEMGVARGEEEGGALDRFCCSGVLAPGSVSPRAIGSMVRGAPRKAAYRESDSTRYLPAFTEEIAYITTKKASSRVTRSP